ncbi:MAG: methyltransferase domain-containing protein [Anaerolineae bacterium]|nr:methyltransferase domain-containing protein [Anaerolineae bacterium]
MSDGPKYDLGGVFDPATAHPDDAHSLLMRLVPPNSQVLELGCATGYLSGYMERALGCRVTGLEFDPASAEIARSRASEIYIADLDAPNALEPASTSAPYDVLFAAAVLEHLKDAPGLLHAVRPLLKTDARVIVSLPNVAHWSVRWALLRGRFNYTDYGIMDRTHLHFYTARTGHALLEGNGYHVEAFHIAGSGLQNALNARARRRGRPLPHPILPGPLAYELIYVARPLN